MQSVYKSVKKWLLSHGARIMIFNFRKIVTFSFLAFSTIVFSRLESLNSIFIRQILTYCIFCIYPGTLLTLCSYFLDHILQRFVSVIDLFREQAFLSHWSFLLLSFCYYFISLMSIFIFLNLSSLFFGYCAFIRFHRLKFICFLFVFPRSQMQKRINHNLWLMTCHQLTFVCLITYLM